MEKKQDDILTQDMCIVKSDDMMDKVLEHQTCLTNSSAVSIIS
jgi:hypothetical protein